MKRNFVKVLPLALAAILFATSCSKDENNDNVVPDNQEQVIGQEKTVSVKGSVNVKSGISKLACTDGTNITFDGGEEISFSGDGDKIHGKTTVDEDGNFTVSLSYPASEELEYYLNGKVLTATIGTAPTNATGSYDDINAAVKDIYETGTTQIEVRAMLNFSGSGISYDVSFLGNVEMGIEVAFVKNEKSEAINVSVNDGAPVSLAAGKICIVPSGVKITADGKIKNTTVAGEIYTIDGVVSVTGITLTGGFNSSSDNPYVWGSETTDYKTLTLTVLPAEATNKNVIWESSNSDLVTVDNNGKITIIAPNETEETATITITATAQDGSGVTGTYTLYLANYVQLADAKWYTYDSQTSVTWANRNNDAPEGSAVPSHIQLAQLGSNIINGTQIKSNNGSNAYITLNYGDYWSSSGNNNNAYYLLFNSSPKVDYKSKDSNCRVRLVRAQ